MNRILRTCALLSAVLGISAFSLPAGAAISAGGSTPTKSAIAACGAPSVGGPPSGENSIQSVGNGGYFVSAELGYTGAYYAILRARDSGAVGAWEEWYLDSLGGCEYALQSLANGRYVTAELSYTGKYYATLRADAADIGPWQQFWFTPGCDIGCT